MQSVKDVATAQQVDERTVRNWLKAARGEGKDLGMLQRGKRLFTREEVAVLVSYGRRPDAAAPAEPAAPTSQPAVSVSTGNHCTALDVPTFNGMTIDLGQFRDSSALVIDDPLLVAEQFLQTADLIQGALADDIAAREARLARTKKAREQVAAKSQELALEQRLYRLQTTQLDTATTEEALNLADEMAKMQALGQAAAERSQGNGLNSPA